MAGALRAVQRADRKRPPRDMTLIAAEIYLATLATATAAVGAGTYLAARAGSRAVRGVQARLAARADAEEQRLAARNTAEEVDTEREEAKSEFLRAARQQKSRGAHRGRASHARWGRKGQREVGKAPLCDCGADRRDPGGG